MDSNGIQRVSPGGTLSAEHYQTYEMALEHDGVLGGDNIAQIRSYAAYARAQAQAIHKTIAATSGIEDVAAIKAEMLETEQTFARVGIYADQRIGELLRKLPTRQGARTDTTSVTSETEVTKRQAEHDTGISHKTSIDLQALAANPDVVQAVLDKATADGRVASRAEVLRAIRERDEARAETATARQTTETLQAQVDTLRQQAAQRPEPEIVEREVVKEVVREVVPESTTRHIEELERMDRIRSDDNKKLRSQLEEARKELDRAKDLLGMDKTLHDVRSDVQYLVSATNGYVRRYGGLTWTVQQLELVDDATREELKKAAINLATFASALVASLEEIDVNR